MWVGPLGVGRLFAWIHFFFNPTKIKMKIISKEQHKFSNHVHLFTCRQTHQVYWLLFFNKNSMFIVHWYSSPNRNSWIKAAAVLWLFSKYMVHYLYSCMSPVVYRQVLFSVSLFSFSFFSFKGFNLEPSCAIFMPYSLDRPTPLWAVLKTGSELAWRLSYITLTLRWQLKASENHGSSGRKNWLVEEKCVNMQSVAWAWGRERNWFQTHFLILFVVCIFLCETFHVHSHWVIISVLQLLFVASPPSHRFSSRLFWPQYYYCCHCNANWTSSCEDFF